MKRFFRIILSLTLASSLLFSSSIPAEAKAAKKNVVIVLDPGHDTTHLGCQYAGYDEGLMNLYIAYGCMAELQKYSGVTVYMTRYGFDCVYGADPNSTAVCLDSRVNYAKNVKADAYVALHNDFDGEGDVTQNGAKVICPNTSYRPDIATKGTALGASILTELTTTTGLAVNNWKLDPNGTGLVTRNGSSTYPDGSVRDYYAVINKTKSAGIPGIIVEHAYLSNASDRTNHLTTPEQLMVLGAADATGIAKYYGLKLK